MPQRPDNEEDDEQLLPVVTRTSEERFTEIYEAHAGEIHSYCLRRLPASDAADAVAEVFSVVWRRLAEIEPERARGWLFGVARGVVSNQWRSNRRRHRLQLRLVSTHDRSSGQGSDEQADENDRVTNAIARLSRRDQELLQLAAWEELTAPEIAEALGISTSAVHQRLHRARTRLAAYLPSGMEPT